MKKNDSLSKNTVVATIMSNIGLFKALEAEGIYFRYSKNSKDDGVELSPSTSKLFKLLLVQYAIERASLFL